MFVWVRVCLICMHTCTYVRTCGYACARSMCKRVCVCVWMFCVHACICVSMWASARVVPACVIVSARVHSWVSRRIQARVYVCAHEVHMRACAYLCWITWTRVRFWMKLHSIIKYFINISQKWNRGSLLAKKKKKRYNSTYSTYSDYYAYGVYSVHSVYSAYSGYFV